jgi:capsular exopolysaccharide synthesis family protein
LELFQYVRLLRKWAWLIVLAAFVGGGIAFVVASQRPPVYQAQTTIAIGGFIEQPNPDSTEIRTGIDLALTYAQLVRTFDVLQATIDQLALDRSPDSLRSRISTSIIAGTSLLVISVNFDDPVLAADIANTLADQLIAQSPTNLTPQQEEQIAFTNQQINDTNAQVQELRVQLEVIGAQLAVVTDADEIARLTTQRNATIDQINQAQATIADFSNTIVSLQQRTNALDIVERARIPDVTSGPSLLSTTLIGVVIGALLALGGVLLYEYLDDAISSTDEAARVMALPVLGAIMRFGKRNDKYAQRLIVNYPSMSPIVEGYRGVRTNLLYTTGNGGRGVFVFTSANPQEGKTVTISNLAVTMAQAGLNVVLIDADLRRPKVHEMFSLDNKIGLTTLLFSDPSQVPQHDSTGDELPQALQQVMQATEVPRLRVITSGFIPSNPTEILGSALMKRWIDVMRSASSIDVVLIDTPPSLAVADSPVLATTIDADVVIVIDSGSTRRAAGAKAKEQFTALGVEPKGIVVNRVNPRDEYYGYGYGYGYYYAAVPETRRGGLFGRKVQEQNTSI